MNCEEFELIGLDSGRNFAKGAAERTAAQDHANGCSRCAALLESWLVAKAELRALGELTHAVESPSRVEMRLRLEFRTKHHTMKTRRAGAAVAWAMAVAAVLIGAVSWRTWQRTRHEEALRHEVASPMVAPSAPTQNPAGTNQSASALAKEKENEAPAQSRRRSNNAHPAAPSEEDAGTFTLLPGSLAAETEEAAIVRVRMQRGALGALGLPVNEERAGEWIQVDLLVGNDWLPQAVRLAR